MNAGEGELSHAGVKWMAERVSGLLLEPGTVRCWGDNSSAQLGVADARSPIWPILDGGRR